MPDGDLLELVRFERRVTVDDGYGNETGDWIPQFEVNARFVWLRGGETVMAARLTGTQPVVVTVWDESRIRDVTPAWRLVDARTDKVYNIKTATPRETRDYIDFICESGVAA